MKFSVSQQYSLKLSKSECDLEVMYISQHSNKRSSGCIFTTEFLFCLFILVTCQFSISVIQCNLGHGLDFASCTSRAHERAARLCLHGNNYIAFSQSWIASMANSFCRFLTKSPPMPSEQVGSSQKTPYALD